MENMDAACLEMIKENVVKDYFTANIKSEVIFDMLLTPVIPEMIEAAIGEKTEVIAKEFPMFNKNFEEAQNTKDYRNCNADYLLRSLDKRGWYLVELKTTASSEGKDQRENYKKILKNKVSLYKDFVELLAHVYNVSYDVQKDSLQTVFKKIVKIEGDIEENVYTDLAVQKLQKLTRTGSKKYLYIAAQLLEKGVGLKQEEPEFEPLKIIYITPEGGKKVRDEEGIKYVSLKDILYEKKCGEDKRTVSEAVGENTSKKEYWEWLKEVFGACYDDGL